MKVENNLGLAHQLWGLSWKLDLEGISDFPNFMAF